MRRVPVQFAIIVVVAFGIYFVWDFGQRVVTSIRLTEYEQQLDGQLQQAQATQTALIEKKDLAQSDTYVEQVARGWRWAKDGDTIVVTQITPAPTPAVSAPEPTPTPEAPLWQQILNFLFGS
jgi:hypothetical protein